MPVLARSRWRSSPSSGLAPGDGTAVGLGLVVSGPGGGMAGTVEPEETPGGGLMRVVLAQRPPGQPPRSAFAGYGLRERSGIMASPGPLRANPRPGRPPCGEAPSGQERQDEPQDS